MEEKKIDERGENTAAHFSWYERKKTSQQLPIP